MPFYEYECSSCKFYTEVMQKITDAPMTKCPSCGKKALKKLVSAPNFRLKGGGWYETDFKGDKESKRNLAGADKEDSPKSESTPASAESAKTEASKPETAKADAGTADKAAKPAAASGGGSSGAESKSSPVRRSSGAGARSAKPVARTAAAKARPVAASRSKGKAKPTARKKARR